MFCLNFRENNRNRLRIFVFQIIGQNVLVNIAELIPHGTSGRAADFFHNGGNTILIQRFGKQAFRTLESTDEGAGVGGLFGKLLKQLLNDVGIDLAQAGHDNRKLLDFLIVHQRKDLRRLILVQRHHQDCRLLLTGK